jgi:hypothetical protein
MSDLRSSDWLSPIEHEAATQLVDLLRLGSVEEATLTRDPETGAVRVRFGTSNREEGEGLLAFVDLPLPG